MVSLCVAGCGKNNEKQESYGKNNEKQKSSSESKEKKVKSVKVSVEDIKAMYKGWTIEEQENGIGFNTFENDERNYLRVYYCGWIPLCSRRKRNCIPYSSGIMSRWVAIRQRMIISAPSKSPIVRFVFPISIPNSIRGLFRNSL